jgi:hypothetical protein
VQENHNHSIAIRNSFFAGTEIHSIQVQLFAVTLQNGKEISKVVNNSGHT